MQTVNVRMWKQSNNGNDRLREQTSKSSCQATAATKTTIATMMGICICARINFFGTLTFHKNANSRCAYVEAKKQWKRQTQTTNNKIVMQDDDGDEQLSLQTMPINICTRRTLMVVPHWHIDFFKNTTVNVRMRSHNKDGNDRIRRQTTKSSCKTTTAMKNCRYRRCQSASVHVELSWLFHIGT